MNYSYRISQSGNHNNNIYSASDWFGFNTNYFWKKNQVWLFNKYKACTAKLKSYIEFWRFYNPGNTLTFLELFNTNNFDSQSFTQLSFQSYLNTLKSYILILKYLKQNISL